MRRVLDHGYVKIVDSMGDDDEALRDARMSTDKDTGVDVDADDRLRNRLLRDWHTSPFEGAYVKFELQLPMFCLRQLDRHRTIDELGVVIESSDEVPRQFMSRNEFSGRYSQMPDLFYVPLPELVRKQSKTNKQSSDSVQDDGWRVDAAECVGVFKYTSATRANYVFLIDQGVAREQARMILPMNQYTKLRLTGSCLSWLKLFRLRLQPDVQWETRQFVKAAAREMRALWPKTWAAFEEQWLYTVTLRRDEMRRLAIGHPETERPDAMYRLRSAYYALMVDLLAEEPNESWEVTK